MTQWGSKRLGDQGYSPIEILRYFYGSDMYNHGKDKIHYYNVGASYAKSRTRVALSYGRNKEGYVCSGGVCRTIPKYTGANLTITTSF